MKKNQVLYELGIHHDKNVIFIKFDFDTDLNQRVKTLAGVRWSSTRKAWYVLD